jgi:hypothetical protein
MIHISGCSKRKQMKLPGQRRSRVPDFYRKVVCRQDQELSWQKIGEVQAGDIKKSDI